jgi:hypothetical protein
VRRVSLGALWILFCVVLIYGPDCGHGFIKDDYGWIATSRLDGWSGVWRLFVDTPMGFYRPLVSLSFGVSYLLFGLHPFPYGVTNLVIAIMTASAIGWLVVRLGLDAWAGLFAGAVWILNFHGINMSILWTSGRTSLLGTFFAVCAAGALLTSRAVMAGAFVLLALLSKEEPLMLPVVFALWWFIDKRLDARQPSTGRPAVALAPVWTAVMAAGFYLAIRSATGALTVSTAPDYYRYRVTALFPNVLEYFDRSLTFTLSLLLIGAFFVSWRTFRLTVLEKSIALKGLVWLIFGFVLTILIPVRSSLYVLLPTVGSSLIAGAIGSAEWRGMHRRRVVGICLLALPIALLPVYRLRNRDLLNESVLASNVMNVLRQRLALRPIRRVIIYDDPAQRPSIGSAFGDTLPVAVRLFAPEGAPDVIVTVPRGARPSSASAPDTLELMLAGQTLVDRTVP